MAFRPAEIVEHALLASDPDETGLLLAEAGLRLGLPAFTQNALESVSDTRRSPLMSARAAWLGGEYDTVLEILAELEADRVDWNMALLGAQAAWQIGKYEDAEMLARKAIDLASADDTADERDRRKLGWFASYIGALTQTPTVSDAFSERALRRRWRGEAPDNVPILALFDYKSPDLSCVSANLGDFIQSVAVLRHFARFRGVEWSCDEPTLAGSLPRLAASWSNAARIDLEGQAHIAIIDRDAPQSVARRFPGRPVWAIYNGWFCHRPFDKVVAMPAPDNLQPILLGFHLSRPTDLTPEVLGWLRDHAPVGCRDKTTLRWLLNRRIDAFFSGCLTLTLAAEKRSTERQGAYDVDYDGKTKRGHKVISHQDPSLRTALFGDAVERAIDMIDLYAGARTVRTGRLHCALPCRALGTPVSFEVKNSADRRFEGLIDADLATQKALRGEMVRMMGIILKMILSNRDVDAVRKRWAELAARAVREAKKEVFGGNAPPAQSLVQPAVSVALPEGEPVNLVLAFDANYLDKARVVLRSVRANTERPIRLILLVRGLDDALLEPLSAEAEACETRIFHMDGRLSGVPVELLQKITLSTMDRLFVEKLLLDLDRVVYIDCDTIVLGDIAELAAFDPGEQGIAGRPTPNPNVASLAEMSERCAMTMAAPAARSLRVRLAASIDLCQPGFNAGVLVFSLRQLRENGLLECARAFVHEFGLNDQDALNFASTSGYQALPAQWNSIPQFDFDEAPALVHWVGIRKPWMHGLVRCQQHWRVYDTDSTSAKSRKTENGPTTPPPKPAITKAHWLKADSYHSDWGDRAALAAQWIAPGSHVLDLGAGAPLSLLHHLPEGCRYQGADLRAWSDQVVAVDLDTGDFPAGRFDTVVMLGLVEYLERPGQVFASAGKAAPRLIVSYCHPQPGGDSELRTMRGWINAFTAEKLARLLNAQGWTVTDTKIYRENANIRQLLYECERR